MSRTVSPESESRRITPRPEAELPRLEDNCHVPGEFFVAGDTPTRTGSWVTSLIIKAPSSLE